MTKKVLRTFIPIGVAKKTTEDKTQTSINTLRGRIEDLEKRAKHIDFTVNLSNTLVYGVVIVMFLAFLGFGYDFWQRQQTSYDSSNASVNSIRASVEQLQRKFDSFSSSKKNR